jgi:hypothetical protein
MDARERLRDAGLELQAAGQARDIVAKFDHMGNAVRLILEASQRIATAAGVALPADPANDEWPDEAA